MREVKRRKLSDKKAKKFFASPIQSTKLIYEGKIGISPAFIIQFPDADEAVYAPDLEKIPTAFKSDMAIPFDPTGNKGSDPNNLIYIQRWRIHDSEETLQAVAQFAKRHKFDAEGELLVRAQLSGDDGKRLFRLSAAKSNDTIKLPKFGKLKFRPFQKAGIAYAMETKRTFIADEMGLGKTVEAIGVMALAKKWPAVIITPNTLKLNWEAECQKWFGKKKKIIVLRNRDLPALKPEYTAVKKARLVKQYLKFLKSFEIIIVNYDKLRKWLDYFVALAPQMLVFDESHYVKGNSTRSRICKELTDAVAPEYILMLTGTPVMNRPIELIRQLQIMGRMAEFGGVQHFINRFCSIVHIDMSKLPPLPKPDADGNMPELTESDRINTQLHDELIRKHFENQIELNKQLRSICYVRREKSDVLKDLPEKQRTTLSFEITNRAEYERIEADVCGYLGDIAAKDEKFLKSIKKLSREEQVKRIKEVRATKAYKSARAEALVRIEMLKQAAAIGKLDSVKEWIENFFEENPKEKLVVFGNHRKIINELEAAFATNKSFIRSVGKTVTLRSGMSDQARHNAAVQFQEDPKTKLFIGSMKVAGVGLTLTKASNVAFTELGWTPALHDQAEDRCHRITQRNAVTAYYLLAEKTIEEWVAKLIESKRQTVDAVSFGDPIEKVKQTGSILGDLIKALVGKETVAMR